MFGRIAVNDFCVGLQAYLGLDGPSLSRTIPFSVTHCGEWAGWHKSSGAHFGNCSLIFVGSLPFLLKLLRSFCLVYVRFQFGFFSPSHALHAEDAQRPDQSGASCHSHATLPETCVVTCCHALQKGPNCGQAGRQLGRAKLQPQALRGFEQHCNTEG